MYLMGMSYPIVCKLLCISISKIYVKDLRLVFQFLQHGGLKLKYLLLNLIQVQK